MEILEGTEQVISGASAEHYRQVVGSLCQFESEWGSNAWRDEASGTAFAEALGSAEIGLASFKQYAAAIRWVLIDADHLTALSVFDGLLKNLKRPKANKTDVLKFVPTDVSGPLIKLAYSRSAKYSLHLALLLEATLATGLRPKEWKEASLVPSEDGFRLHVVNGKYVPPEVTNKRSKMPTARRGNGPYRELVFIGENDQQTDLAEVISQLLLEEEKSPWERVQKSLRRELEICVETLIENRAIPTLFRRLTIYSFRHQAAADAKATLGTDEGHTAAVLGHAAARTAVDSYGRRGMGRSGIKVRPSQNSVDLVDNKTVPKPPVSRSQPSRRPLPGFGPENGS